MIGMAICLIFCAFVSYASFRRMKEKEGKRHPTDWNVEKFFGFLFGGFALFSAVMIGAVASGS